MPPLGQHGGIGPLVAFPLLLLVFEKGVNLARIHREVAAGQVERVRAGRPEKRPIVRDDQARLFIVPQKVLEQNLRAQVKEVRRLVEQEQVGLVQQQRRQLHARLPPAGEF